MGAVAHHRSKDLARPIRLLCALVIVAVSAGTPADTAAQTQEAGTQVEPRQAAPAWTYDPNATYEEGDITARMAGEGIDRAEAIRRFRLQDSVAGLLKPRIEARWPDTFAGVWINTPPEGFGVNVAFTASAQSNVDELRADFPFPDDLRPVSAAVSLAALRSIQDRMSEDRSALQRGAPPVNLPQPIKATSGQFDIATDVPGNKVVVYVEKSSDEMAEAYRSAYGDRVIVREGLSKPNACAQTDCRYAMLGGIRLEIPDPPSSLYKQCSSGFTAFYTTDPSLDYVITAGHCPRNDQPRQNAFESYGKVSKDTQSGRVDAERVKRLYAPWRESGKFFVQGENPRMVSSYKRHADMTLGDYIGKTGITTGTTRGYVRDLDYRPSYIPNSQDFVRASYCAASGDSGGAVWESTRAWGIHSGHVSMPEGCRDINGNVVSGTQGIYGAIDFALSNLGLSLNTNLNLKPTASFTSSCGAPTCSFSGSASYDEDGSITAYSWNFGDGSTGTGKTASHTYSSPGTYSVMLTVTDNNGTADNSPSATVDLSLNPPVLDSATPTVGVCGVTLSWSDPSSGLFPDAYNVYRGTSSGGPYTFIQTVPYYQTSFADGSVGAATTYYYALKSVAGAWKSGYSNQKSAATGVCVPV